MNQILFFSPSFFLWIWTNKYTSHFGLLYQVSLAYPFPILFEEHIDIQM